MAERGSEEHKAKLRENMATARAHKAEDPAKTGIKKRIMSGKRLRFLFELCREFGLARYRERFSDGSYVDFVFGSMPDFPDEDPEMGPESNDRARAERWSA